MNTELTQQVVLRSRYEQLRALLAVAAITVVALIAAVVILAVDDTAPVVSVPAATAPVMTDTYTGVPGLRFDGGPEEGGGSTQVAPPAAPRFDGGPEEGTRGR